MQTERRKLRVEEVPVRRELENYVVAWNKHLKKAVTGMGNIILLRNASPVYRGDFASKLRDAGLISKEECKEFVKIL